MALAIDGSVHKNLGSSSSTTVSLTTTQPNDYIIVVVETNGGPGLSVSSAAVGSFTRLGRAGSAGLPLEIWAAFSSAALTADTITVTTTNPNFLTIDAFGVSGSGQTSLVFDSGGPQTASTDPVSITTVNANTMVIAAFRDNSTPTPTAGAGFTAVSGANFLLTEYKILSASATTSCTQTTGAGDSNGVVVIAIVQAAATTPTVGARVLQRFNRSKLAYPAGALPGVDLAHRASEGLRFSGIASGGGFFSLLQGRRGTILSTPSYGIDGSLGSVFIPTATNQGATFTGQSIVNDPSATIAGIISFNSVATSQAIFSGSTSNTGWRMIYNTTQLIMTAGSVADINSGLGLVAATPYLIIASASASVTNFLVLNLSTGKILTASVGGATPVAPDSVYYIGNDNFGQPALGKIAAVMFSANFMTLSEMRAWAQDPWSFWYPNKTLNLTGDSGVTPPAIQYAAFSIPQHDGQSLTQMTGY